LTSIAWLVPSLLEGSGGHRTILQHADYLQQRGHRCVLYIEDNGAISESSLRKTIQRMFGFDFDDVRLGWADVKPADLVFATIWYSARLVRDLPFETIRCYFVQDFEAQFNPMGDAYLMAENSYRYGLHPVTIGRWLTAMLGNQFKVEATYFDFCADLGVYRQLPDVQRERAICFIYQPEKFRRCPELGIEALAIVKHFMPDVKIYLYGSRSAARVWFEHENLGLLSLEECNRLYNRCAVGLCISATNPSRIPFEMMAAGLPVVEVYRDNTLYDFPEEAILLCESTPESLAKGMMERLSKQKDSEVAGQAGARFMQERPIEHGLKQFYSEVEVLLTGGKPAKRLVEPMYRQPCLVAEANPQWANSGSATRMPFPDHGRLSFLPPLPRRIVRFFYYGLRRLLS
jgi:O-antigen biosynthesis protein